MDFTQSNKDQKKLKVRTVRGTVLPVYALVALCSGMANADMPNSCPVDGCTISIIAVEKAGDELEVTLEANYTPDNAKNHIHAWWGEQFNAKQVGRNANSEHNVEQGKWHRHDSYPLYVTYGAASTSVRDGATTLCVTAADRDHNVIDADVFHCMDVGAYLN